MLSCQRKQFEQMELTALGVAMHELSSTSDKQEDNQEIRSVCVFFFTTFIMPVPLTAPYKIKTMQKQKQQRQ